MFIAFDTLLWILLAGISGSYIYTWHSTREIAKRIDEIMTNHLVHLDERISKLELED